jgi:hypothetical protein
VTESPGAEARGLFGLNKTGFQGDNRGSGDTTALPVCYDGLKRLYWTDEPISFAYDGDRMIAELAYTNTHPIARRDVHGPGVERAAGAI